MATSQMSSYFPSSSTQRHVATHAVYLLSWSDQQRAVARIIYYGQDNNNNIEEEEILVLKPLWVQKKII